MHSSGNGGGGMQKGGISMGHSTFDSKAFMEKMKKDKNEDGTSNNDNNSDKPVGSIFERMAEENPGGFEDARLCKLRVSEIRILDKCNVALGTFGLMLSTQSYNLEFNLRTGYQLNIILAIISMSCFINLIFTIIKNNYIIKYMVARKEATEGVKQLQVWSLSNLFTEYQFIQVAPSPFFVGLKLTVYFHPLEKTIYYNYNDFLTIIMTCKFIFLLRGILALSVYDSDRGTRVARMFGAQPGFVLVFKCIMKDNPFGCVIILFLGGVSFFGYLIMIAEAPISRLESFMNYSSYINACWGTVATMTTVGYGDMFPRTNLGRLFMIVCSMYGVIVVSLMVVTVTNFLGMSQMESASYTVMKKLEYKGLIKQAALEILVNVNRNTKGDPIREENRYICIKNAIDSFRYLRRVYRNIGELSIYDEMDNHFNKVLGEVQDLKDMIELGTWTDSLKDQIKTEMTKLEKFTDPNTLPKNILNYGQKNQIITAPQPLRPSGGVIAGLGISCRNIATACNRDSLRSITDPNKIIGGAYLKQMERQVRNSMMGDVPDFTENKNRDRKISHGSNLSPLKMEGLDEIGPGKSKFVTYADDVKKIIVSSPDDFDSPRNQYKREYSISSENTLQAVNGSDSDKEIKGKNRLKLDQNIIDTNANKNLNTDPNLESALFQKKSDQKSKQNIKRQNRSINSLKNNQSNNFLKNYERSNTRNDENSQKIINGNYTYIFNTDANYNNSNVNYNANNSPINDNNQINYIENNNINTTKEELKITEKIKKKDIKSTIIKSKKNTKKVAPENTLDAKLKRPANKDFILYSQVHGGGLKKPEDNYNVSKNNIKEELISSRRPLNYEIELDKKKLDDTNMLRKHQKYALDDSYEDGSSDRGRQIEKNSQDKNFSSPSDNDSATNKNVVLPRNRRVNPNSNQYKKRQDQIKSGNKNQVKENKSQIPIYEKRILKSEQKQFPDIDLKTLQNFRSNSKEIVPQIIEPKNIDNYIKQSNISTLSDKLNNREQIFSKEKVINDNDFKLIAQNLYKEDGHDLTLQSRLQSELLSDSQKYRIYEAPILKTSKRKEQKSNVQISNNLLITDIQNQDNNLMLKQKESGLLQYSNQKNNSKNDGQITRDSKQCFSNKPHENLEISDYDK